MSEVLLPTGSAGWIVAPRLRKWMLVRLLVFPVVLLAFPLFLAHLGSFGLLAFDGAFVLLIAGSIGLYIRNERFMADRSSVSRVDWRGHMRSWPLSKIDHVDRFSLQGRSTNSPHMAFKDRDGKALFTVPGQYWDTAQIEEICSRIGLRLTGDFGEVLSVFELGKRLGRKQQRRVLLAAAFFVVAALAVAFVFVLATPGR